MALSLEERERAFRALYADHFDAVLGFALRRVDRPEDAGDVTADTFLVAWRRLGHAPQGDELRWWLYGVARRVLANHRRGERRRTALGDRLRRELSAHVPDASDDVVQRADVVAAMGRLSARDQEVLELHLWEGLQSREIPSSTRPWVANSGGIAAREGGGSRALRPFMVVRGGDSRLEQVARYDQWYENYH